MVELTPEVVKARLTALENLVSELDGQIAPLQGVRQRQGPGVWSPAPESQGFAQSYGKVLDALAQNLTAMRTRVGELQVALKASADSLGRVDQDVQDRLTALANKITAGPPIGPQVCTAYDDPTYTAPAVATPVPAATAPESSGAMPGWGATS